MAPPPNAGGPPNPRLPPGAAPEPKPNPAEEELRGSPKALPPPKAEPAAAESRVLAAGGAVAATLACPEGAPQGHHGRLQHRCVVDAMALTMRQIWSKGPRLHRLLYTAEVHGVSSNARFQPAFAPKHRHPPTAIQPLLYATTNRVRAVTSCLFKCNG